MHFDLLCIFLFISDTRRKKNHRQADDFFRAILRRMVLLGFIKYKLYFRDSLLIILPGFRDSEKIQRKLFPY